MRVGFVNECLLVLEIMAVTLQEVIFLLDVLSDAYVTLGERQYALYKN